MSALTRQLAQYAGYHRDPRNIATHFVGVPMILFAIQLLLHFPSVALAGWTLTPAALLSLLLLGWYLRLGLLLGLAMAVQLLGGLWLAGQWLAVWPGSAVSGGIGLFLVGWVIQFVGHYFEGRKPAFTDDLVGLAVGPLFVMAEFLFLWGVFRPLQQEIDAIAGPVRRNPHRLSST